MKVSTTDIVKVGILAAVSVPLMLFDFPLPFFVPFLKIDLSDVPAMIAAVSLGPLQAVFTELIKNLVKLLIKNDTGGVGELANFIVGCAYILPLSLVCVNRNKHRFMTRTHVVTTARFAVGASLGAAAMVAVACLVNYFVLIPVYAAVFNLPVSEMVDMGHALNSRITDLRWLVLLSIAPFNLIKAVVVSLVGYAIYRLFKRFL
ncbi:MAG: ECF transporter S component [Clostridiales bacterium]|nr:ECF transporter S component [Clostridiales bacterium]